MNRARREAPALAAPREPAPRARSWAPAPPVRAAAPQALVGNRTVAAQALQGAPSADVGVPETAVPGTEAGAASAEAPVTPPPVPPAPEPEAPGAADETPAAPPGEQLDLAPFTVDLPVPASAPPEDMRFEVPRWDAGSLRPRGPAADAGSGRELGGAISRAQSRYSALLGSVRQRHDSVVRHAQSVQQEISMAYQRFAGTLPGEMERVDGSLDGTLRQHFAAIDGAALDADGRIEAAHQRARATLGAAVVQGRIAIEANRDSAEAQITAVIRGLASLYVGTLNAAATAVRTAGATALAHVNTWERGTAGVYDTTVGGLQGAENEAKMRAVPGLAATVRSGLATRSAEALRDFTSRETTETTNIDNSVRPTLNARRDAINARGLVAVNRAFNQASATLGEQARLARESIATMRTDARARAFARRGAARASIAAIATRSVKDARRESDSAQRALGSALQPSLAVFAQSVRQVQAALGSAAPSGAVALDKASAAAPAGADVASSRAVSAQTTKIDGTGSAVQASMVQTQRQAGVEAAGEQQKADAEMGASVEQDLPAFAATADSQIEGFANVSDGVRAATAEWSAPLATTFATYIAEVRAELKARHDGPVGDQPGFKAQVDSVKQPFLDWTTLLATPETYFAEGLNNAWNTLNTTLRDKAARAGDALYFGIIDTVDEAGLSRALRNITQPQGSFIRTVFESIRHRTIDETLQFRQVTGDLDRDEYDLALTYLAGNAREGNRRELLAALGTFNDDEARIEEMMRSLSQTELNALHATAGWAEAAAEVRDDLGGTDLRVFDALDAGNPARADALRWRDRMDEARRRGETDSLHDAAAEYSGAATYQGDTVDADKRRQMVQREFARLLVESGDITEAQAATPTAAVTAYGTRSMAVVRHDFWRGTHIETEAVSGANAALFGDILAGGEDSVAARQSRLAVEFGREGGPRMLRVDRALVDARLNPASYPDGVVPPAIAATARLEREQLATGFRTRFGGTDPDAGMSDRDYLGSRIDTAFGTDRSGAGIANELLRQEVPSPQTASRMMRYAMTHETGTNEALMERVTGRMNRDEIARMSEHYGRSGRSLHADLGVYGQGRFGELSGDERLAMEVRLLGVPRNDRERAEVATFTAQQQRDETGGFGSFLTSGDFQADSLAYETARLRRTSGIAVERDANGVPIFSGGEGNFRAGQYVGTDRATFDSSTAGAVSASRAYAARVDTYANFAANAVMVIGAVAATVLTAGGAGPFLLAAMAAGTGLTAMAARAMISGGRYGWEQAMTDLGTTVVQALTAGLGATLGLASRGGQAAVGTGLRAGLTGRVPAELMRANMGRLTGTALGDTLAIGAATSALNSVGSTALNAATWDRGIVHGIGDVFAAGGTGAFTGALGAGITHGLGAITPGRIAPIGARMAEPNRAASVSDLLGRADPVTRALGQGTIAGISGFGTSYADLAIQSARGRYRGDAGDMAMASGDAALQAGFQGAGESFGEQIVQHRMARRAAQAAAPVATAPAPVPDALPDVPGADVDGAGPPPARGPQDGAVDSAPDLPDGAARLAPGMTDAGIDAALDVADARGAGRTSPVQADGDMRPLRPPGPGEPTPAQRQRADVLREEAGRVAQQAEATLQNAIARDDQARRTEEYNPRRAGVLHAEVDTMVARAAALEDQAGALRGHADDYASGRRPVAADLPPADVLQNRLQRLTPDESGLIDLPRSQGERQPETLDRLARALIGGEEAGRLVLGVESERSRQLISIDAPGNVVVAGGASARLTAGSFERAVENVLDHAGGGARIVAVEADQGRVSAAPVRDTGAPGARADGDQPALPPRLSAEIDRFVTPVGGAAVDTPAIRAASGGDGTAPATRHASPSEQDAMRQSLLRHVPPDQHDAMAGVPIRVLPADEYRALTRSDSGPVVTIIENGQPVVIMREGTPIGRLADEGPHLSQAHETGTRAQVGRLDEAHLANWDNLDLDTQVDLYRNKIDLEIDAHTRIGASLEREANLPGADRQRLAQESERNGATLRNLQERQAEVAGLGPRERADIASGARTRPQYLDQPARLFSKGPPYPDQPSVRPSEPAADAPRQEHEFWVENARRFLLDPGSVPPMAPQGRAVADPSIAHPSLQAAYADFDAALRASGGQGELGITRDPVTGMYMVGRSTAPEGGAPVAPAEPVLSYRPDEGGGPVRGPSDTELLSAIQATQASGRPTTQFIEHGSADTRGRTAFTTTEVVDAAAPGGRRIQIDVEFIDSASGQYVHHRFQNEADWIAYNNGSATARASAAPVDVSPPSAPRPHAGAGDEPAPARLQPEADVADDNPAPVRLQPDTDADTVPDIPVPASVPVVEEGGALAVGQDEVSPNRTAQASVDSPAQVQAGGTESLTQADLGAKLGSGGNKDVFAFGEGQAVGVLRPGKNPALVEEELSLLRQIDELGLPTVNARGPIMVDGQPALVFDRFAQGSKDVVRLDNGRVRVVGASPLLNQRSASDLRAIRRAMVDNDIRINDLQFLIADDGRVVIADPLGVQVGVAPSKNNLRMIDLLIEQASRGGR